MNKQNKNSDNEDSDDDDWKDEEQETSYPDFPSFDLAIKEAMKKLSKKVFIKLNWSSPKDAAWSLSKLSCDKLSDIYILLRSSDFVNHDLNLPFDGCDDKRDGEKEREACKKGLNYFLVMREWISLNPSMEFRCFVANNRLIGKFRKYFYGLNRLK